jgi:hypothetical protein
MFLRHLPECRHSSLFHSIVSSPLVKYLIFFKVIPVKYRGAKVQIQTQWNIKTENNFGYE